MKKNRNFLSLMHNFYFPLFFVCFLQWVCIWQAHFPNNFSDFFFVQWSTLRKVCCFCWQILIKGTWPSTALCTLHPALEVEGLLERQQQFAYRRKHAWVQNSTTVGRGSSEGTGTADDIVVHLSGWLCILCLKTYWLDEKIQSPFV